MQYVISFLVAIVGLILGNWLSLLLYFPVLLILAKVFPESKGQKWGALTLYISRACMGITVSLIFELFIYFGAIISVLTFTFGIWTLLFSEPFSEVQAHDICRGNLDKYQRLRRNLKITRIFFYFLPIFLLYGIMYILYV